MAQSSSASRQHWAILIGIDYYKHEKCLQGCVRDVLNVKDYLEAGPDPVNISMLTATTPSDPSSHLPLEDPHSWPTMINFVNELQRVVQNAKPRDLVYIHYSGHGSREGSSKTSGDQSAQQLGNLAFVLFENNKYGITYFKGEILASCLKKMVEDKELLVTVVLDCCFSGSVLRAGDVRAAGIRSVEYNSAADAALPQHEGCLHDVSRDTSYHLRDSTLWGDEWRDKWRDKWLVNPEGYTILSACGPHEVAQELETRNGEKRGALSYFLLKTLSILRKQGVEITHESLYEHMRIVFHVCWPQQTPMRYGNKNFSFFNGPATASNSPFIQVYTKSNGLCLDAGEAHGVHTGDTYALYSPEWLVDATDQAHNVPVTAQVDVVRCLTSDLAKIMPETAATEIGTGWHARPLTSLSQRKISVRLPASFNGQARQTGATEDMRYLRLCSEEDAVACMFHVVLDQDRYKILNGLNEAVANLPAIPADEQGAERLMDSLQHISKFKYAEGIENRTPDAQFEASFSCVSSVSGGEPRNSSVFDVEHGGTWQLEIRNNSNTALYLALFDFGPSWKIHNLLSDSGNGGFWVLEPNCPEPLPLVMEVPEFMQRNGQGCCEDVIKLFVTNKAATFPSMVLPELPLYGSYHRGQPYKAGDGLSALVAGLTGSARSDDARHEKWATRSFIIRTIKK
ncbi:hypothetical protein TGAMA5MH_03955 [Trichoderma gamsii]|uniref:Peptidase C14 caspase domain-containing protein n=1 Tax=Trichoderma gamsii TaxID=398673 RepID=A0A2K0TFQ2_9HYPO|nr:hypothetical protein TGAMA5MH_03955 [Trichoderma gamsii]